MQPSGISANPLGRRRTTGTRKKLPRTSMFDACLSFVFPQKQPSSPMDPTGSTRSNTTATVCAGARRGSRAPDHPRRLQLDRPLSVDRRGRAEEPAQAVCDRRRGRRPRGVNGSQISIDAVVATSERHPAWFGYALVRGVRLSLSLLCGGKKRVQESSDAFDERGDAALARWRQRVPRGWRW
jgi:hypothetical protein